MDHINNIIFAILVVLAIILLICYCKKDETFYEPKLKLNYTKPPTIT